jgi:hypothetical protein
MTLRESLDQAAGNVIAGGSGSPATDISVLAAAMEELLLSSNGTGRGSAAAREYALRQLSSRYGTVVLPSYDVGSLTFEDRLSEVLVTQLGELQDEFNLQIAGLPELEGRKIEVQDVQLRDPRQIEAAIKGLELQSELLGIDFGDSLRYQSLQALSEELLGGSISLEGLDLSELETISRELLAQLGMQDKTGAAVE